MDPFGRGAEPFGFLLEEDVDAVEENRRATGLVLFVQGHGQVKRHHEDIVALLAKRGDQGVVAETISAKHGTRAGRDLDDVHAGSIFPAWNKYAAPTEL